MEQQTKQADEKFCQDCGGIIKLKAEICPKCGVRQIKNSSSTQDFSSLHRPRGIGFSVTSFILGLVAFFGSLDESEWGVDASLGLCLLIIFSIILAIVTIREKYNGQGMAVAGIVFSVLSTLICLGSQP